MDSHEKVNAFLVLDIIGRPAEFLVESLNKMIEDMKKEPGVKVKGSSVKDPVNMKENKDFFTTFAEIEVEADNVMHLAALMFKYMPAHVEVVSPENITLPNTGWSEILSELTRRLHSYDEVARVVQAEKAMLMKKLHELQGGKAKKEKKDSPNDVQLKKD